jgi:hypothetical protein
MNNSGQRLCGIDRDLRSATTRGRKLHDWNCEATFAPIPKNLKNFAACGEILPKKPPIFGIFRHSTRQHGLLAGGLARLFSGQCLNLVFERRRARHKSIDATEGS